MQHCPSVFTYYSIDVFDQQNINNIRFNDISINSWNCKLIWRENGESKKSSTESLSKLSDLIQEDLSGISAIKIYAQENAEKKEFNTHNNTYRNSAIKLARTASTLFPLLQGISSISLLILLGLGTYQLESGFISIGGLIALILYVERLVFPTALLGFTLNTFQLGQVSLDRVEEIFQNNPNIIDGTNTKFLRRKVKGLLEAKDLKIKYQDQNSTH